MWDDEIYSEEIKEHKSCKYFLFPSCLYIFLSVRFFYSPFLFYSFISYFFLCFPFILSPTYVQKLLVVIYYKTGQKVPFSKISTVNLLKLFFNFLCVKTWARSTCVLPTLSTFYFLIFPRGCTLRSNIAFVLPFPNIRKFPHF